MTAAQMNLNELCSAVTSDDTFETLAIKMTKGYVPTLKTSKTAGRKWNAMVTELANRLEGFGLRVFRD